MYNKTPKQLSLWVHNETSTVIQIGGDIIILHKLEAK